MTGTTASTIASTGAGTQPRAATVPPAFNATGYLVDRQVGAGRGGQVALTCEGVDVTYRQLQVLTARVASALGALGMRREERVLFVMVDGIELAAGILGAIRAGMVAVPVNTMLTATDLGRLIADCRARTVICSPDFADAAAKAVAAVAAQGGTAVARFVVTGDVRPSLPAGITVLGWDEALAEAGPLPSDALPSDALSSEPEPPVPVGEDASALWLYTSGTTGMPKAAMHRQVNIRHVCETYGRQVLGVRAGDRCLSVAKLFFAYGIGNSLFFPLSVGATAILDPRRATPAGVAERARADHPTVFHAVPAFFAAMLAADLPADTLAQVRIATSAGEALPASLQQRWTDRFGVQILDGLGSTEALHIFVSNAPGDIGPGTSGRPVPGYEVQVRGDDGLPVPPGTPGTLFVRGESIATGYWCRTATTRAVFQGEWLATGDTYLQDAEGRYRCLGRAWDMIKAGGIWVSPGEVEGRLLQHPDVAEAAVVAGRDDEGLERPVAVVVLVPGAAVSAEELITFCRAELAHFKVPRALAVVDELPRTATGKLQRFRVREQLTARNVLATTA